MSNTNDVKSNGGKALAAKMTAEQRKEKSLAMVRAKKTRNETPQAVYKGTLKIGEIEIQCAVLADGTRIISEAGIYNHFGATGGKLRQIRSEMEEKAGAPIPLFLASKSLEPFISEVFNDGHLEYIEYFNNGTISRGYPASILPKVCDIWLKAREANVLQKQQLAKAQKAEILMRGLAHVGIVALVDEATGYQENREKDALAKILEKFVAKELQVWVKTFPLDYYKELCRLYGVPFPPEKNNQFPQFFGHVTNNAIYSRLAPELLPELKKTAQKMQKKAKLHQWLTSDIGHPKLREHLASIVTLLKLSKTPDDFKNKVDLIHPRIGTNMEFDFNEIIN